jgi:hypothetical protein
MAPVINGWHLRIDAGCSQLMNQWNVMFILVNLQLKELSRSCGDRHRSLYSITRSLFIFFTQKKGKVFLCTGECIWRNGSIVPVILNLSTRWDEWSGFHHCSFIPGGKACVTYWAFLGSMGKRKISCPSQELKSDSLYVHLLALSLFWLYCLALCFIKETSYHGISYILFQIYLLLV